MELVGAGGEARVSGRPEAAVGERKPTVLLLAGPNGAGKTTASRLVIPRGVTFVNADLIARRLADEGHPAAGLDAAAGRIVLAEVRRLEAHGASFCLETNLAGRGLVRSIARWKSSGFRVGLAFIALASPELAIARVAERVEGGGHDVPEPVVRRRWRQGLRVLFSVYIDLVDDWTLADNSGDRLVPVARATVPERFEVLDRELWEYFRGLAGAEDDETQS